MACNIDVDTIELDTGDVPILKMEGGIVNMYIWGEELECMLFIINGENQFNWLFDYIR